MVYKYEFGFSKAIKVDTNMLKYMDEEIKKYCNSTKWSCELENKDKIDFDNIEELIDFENSKKYFLRSINVRAEDNNFKNRINIYIEANDIWWTKNSETINVEMKMDSLDNQAAFRKRMGDIFERYEQNRIYNFISKNGIVNIVSLMYWIVFMVFFFNFISKGFNINSINKVLLFAFWGITILYYISKYLKKLQKKYYPQIVFYIGDGISIYDNNENGRNNFFWTVIVGGIILGTIFLGVEMYLNK